MPAVADQLTIRQLLPRGRAGDASVNVSAAAGADGGGISRERAVPLSPLVVFVIGVKVASDQGASISPTDAAHDDTEPADAFEGEHAADFPVTRPALLVVRPADAGRLAVS
jgi:hypothetical protein